MTQEENLFLFLFFSICLQELKPFLKHFNPRIELCKKKTQRIERLFFFEEIWLKDLIFSCQKIDSKIFELFFIWLKNRLWLKELNPFSWNLTKIEELNFFWKKKEMTQRIELSFWNRSERIKLLLRETWLEYFFEENHSKNWTFSYDSQNWTIFEKWFTEFNASSQHDFKNWTHFFLTNS